MAQDNVTTPADAAPPSTPCATRLGAGTPLRPERLAVADWMALAVSAGVLIAFRLHAFDLPLETDECNYAYIGARLLAGDRLYVDVWDHQPFGIFALFAAMIAMFGDAPEVFRGLAMVFSVGSLALLFLIVRRLSTTWIAACAALTFAVVSSDPGTAGEGCNREVFMNTFVLAAWWLTLRGGGSIRSLVLGGFLLGIGSTIKTVLAVHWLALAVWAIASASRTESASTTASNRWRRLFALSAGPAIIWGTSLMYFAATWRARDFLDAAFRFNLGYSGSSEGFFARFVRFFSPVQHPFLFDSAWPLWAWLVPTTAWLLWTWTTRRHRGAAPALLVLASYVATCLPGRFWPHYYYLMIPPAVIAGTLAAGDLARLARHWIARRNPPPVPA
ncbi:MAG: glycosyltransferase family 39 protein, partial [Phycisphaerae bacterium]